MSANGERVEWDPQDLPEAKTELFEVDMLRIDPTRLDVYDIIHASPSARLTQGCRRPRISVRRAMATEV